MKNIFPRIVSLFLVLSLIAEPPATAIAPGAKRPIRADLTPFSFQIDAIVQPTGISHQEPVISASIDEREAKESRAALAGGLRRNFLTTAASSRPPRIPWLVRLLLSGMTIIGPAFNGLPSAMRTFILLGTPIAARVATAQAPKPTTGLSSINLTTARFDTSLVHLLEGTGVDPESLNFRKPGLQPESPPSGPGIYLNGSHIFGDHLRYLLFRLGDRIAIGVTGTLGYSFGNPEYFWFPIQRYNRILYRSGPNQPFVEFDTESFWPSELVIFGSLSFLDGPYILGLGAAPDGNLMVHLRGSPIERGIELDARGLAVGIASGINYLFAPESAVSEAGLITNESHYGDDLQALMSANESTLPPDVLGPLPPDVIRQSFGYGQDDFSTQFALVTGLRGTASSPRPFTRIVFVPAGQTPVILDENKWLPEVGFTQQRNLYVKYPGEPVRIYDANGNVTYPTAAWHIHRLGVVDVVHSASQMRQYTTASEFEAATSLQVDTLFPQPGPQPDGSTFVVTSYGYTQWGEPGKEQEAASVQGSIILSDGSGNVPYFLLLYWPGQGRPMVQVEAFAQVSHVDVSDTGNLLIPNLSELGILAMNYDGTYGYGTFSNNGVPTTARPASVQNLQSRQGRRNPSFSVTTTAPDPKRGQKKPAADLTRSNSRRLRSSV